MLEYFTKEMNSIMLQFGDTVVCSHIFDTNIVHYYV